MNSILEVAVNAVRFYALKWKDISDLLNAYKMNLQGSLWVNM